MTGTQKKGVKGIVINIEMVNIVAPVDLVMSCIHINDKRNANRLMEL